MLSVEAFAGRGASRAAFWGCIGLLVAFDANAYHRRWDHVTISGTPATSDVAGQAYSFSPTASDTGGYPLTFSISGKPAWASFNTSTGQLTGTPTSTNVGTYSNIVISAYDGHSSASLAPFSISVSAPANTAPTISGQPTTALNVGTAYAFTPTASDTDGDKLTFSIQNMPAWATFSSTTGQLSGTPTASNVGTYSNIIISVSDGVTSASLAPFSIAVNQVSSGSTTLTWTPPTTNSDGSALTNLAGYNVYYGTVSNNLNQVIKLANPGLASYTVTNLAAGTWYFSVSVYTSAGVESVLSNSASTTIQ